MKLKIVMYVIALLPLTGCISTSKEPASFGERLQAQGKELAVIGEKWSEGKSLIKEGEETMEEGNELIEKGHKKLERGKSMIEKGRRMMEEAEQEYQKYTGASTLPLE